VFIVIALQFTKIGLKIGIAAPHLGFFCNVTHFKLALHSVAISIVCECQSSCQQTRNKDSSIAKTL